MSARTGSNIEAWLAPRWSRGAAALARPLPAHASAAAIRIPDRLSAQLALVFPTASPQLFIHEGARQALERKLKAMSPGRVVILSITDNRHSIISHSMRHGVLHARIHHMFLDAPARVVNALVRYITRGDKRASELVGHYIEANGARLARRRPRAIPLVAKGTHHDLLALFQDINQRYFGGACHALITWGKKQPRRSEGPRKAIKLGSYSSLERVIRIHPTLDRSWVPRYFVAFVVYHEMLHHMIPAARGSMRPGIANLSFDNSRRHGHVARRVLHPPEFMDREQLFRSYERALEWERRHIGRLLRTS
ncbi:MAG TPA: hypothetical protein VLT33_17995 [Labilithrix sp.]|nr:hypothetical protein [Labilithrix sp.]